MPRNFSWCCDEFFPMIAASQTIVRGFGSRPIGRAPAITPMADKNAQWSHLMAAAQNGDHRAYQELLRAIIPVITRIVRHRWPMAQPAEVDDVVQETLKSLHSVRHTYMADRPFLPWLVAITQHRLADERRKVVRRRGRETEIDYQDETFLGAAPNPEYADVAEVDALRKAINQLPPRQRTAMELLKLKEMSLKEAAAASGMSIAALKVASHRALKTLRDVLSGAH